MKRNEPFFVLYEDDSIIVVDKSSGISVTADRWDDSAERLDELVSKRLRDAVAPDGAPDGGARAFIVHRIDRDTSGLVVLAKTREAHKRLSAAFEDRRVEKSYLAVVRGSPAWTEESCELPLRPDGDKLHRTIIDRGRGKPSYTAFRVLGSVGTLSWLEARPRTGRTHQIRVHLAALGFPIACDPLYGNDKPVLLSSFKKGWRGDPFEERPLLDRLGLHARSLSFDHPGSDSGGRLRFVSPLSRDMAALLAQCEKVAGHPFLEDEAGAGSGPAPGR